MKFDRNSKEVRMMGTMERNRDYNTGKNAVTGIFISVQLIIYIIFMYGDLFGSISAEVIIPLKFISILFCIAFAVYSMNSLRTRDNYILVAALCFTGVSDYFLLLTEHFTYGMMSFCVVQILYLLRLQYLEREGGKGSRYGMGGKILINLVFWLLVLAGLYKLKLQVNLLLSVSVFYFIAILHNVYASVKNAKTVPNKKNIVFAAGMILFILCDINVGIYNMTGFITIEGMFLERLYNFSEIAMWMFYLPAQVCIALSGYLKGQSKN